MIDLYKVFYKNAGVAQLVEQLICNQQVAGSSPIASFFTSYFIIFLLFGEIPKWPKGTDCKSVGIAYRRFESFYRQIGYYIQELLLSKNVSGLA